MSNERPVYVVHFRPEPRVDSIRALRWVLKVALRQFGMRAVKIAEQSSSNEEHMPVTPAKLQRNARRLDKLNAAIEATLTAMKHGATLHLRYGQGGRGWYLSNGHPVTDEVAKIVIQNIHVAGVGDALFDQRFVGLQSETKGANHGGRP
jgi:hypothetical protein